MENEIWKDVNGFGDKYQVSTMGRVRNKKTMQMLKPSIRRYGYKTVTLYESWNGFKKVFYIHRLVALAFLENPSGYNEINHKDRNPSNNSLDNLEWCDRRYNSIYQGARERAVQTSRQRGVYGKPISEAAKEKLRVHPHIIGNSNRAKRVYMLSNDGRIERVFKSTTEAQAITGVSRCNISACCYGRLKHAGGKKWTYDYETTS